MAFNVDFISLAKFNLFAILPYPIPFSFQSILSLPSLLFCRCHSFLQPTDKTKCACVFECVCFSGEGAERGESLIFFFLRAIPVPYGGSQARAHIGAAAAALHHSHSNTGSELHLRPSPQLMAMLEP